MQFRCSSWLICQKRETAGNQALQGAQGNQTLQGAQGNQALQDALHCKVHRCKLTVVFPCCSTTIKDLSNEILRSPTPSSGEGLQPGARSSAIWQI